MKRYRLFRAYWAACVVAFLFALSARAHAGDTLELIFIIHEQNDSYREVISAASAALKSQNSGIRLHTLIMDEAGAALVSDLPPAEHRLLVPIGSIAAGAIIQAKPANPVFTALVPKQTFDNIKSKMGNGANVHALFLDQPFERQIRLAQLVRPHDLRLTAILGPTSQHHKPALEAAAATLGQKIDIATHDNPDKLDGTLSRVLTNSNLLLAIPDPKIFNNQNVQYLFLSTYRNNVPILGFSAPYVKAGALAAVFSTTAQIGKNLAEIILDWQKSGYAAADLRSTYPKYFTVKVNNQVARSLNLDGLNEERLHRQLMQDTGDSGQ
ncbi:MAG: ABC transporter substrate binding protein [Pseudomonadota bacterium]